MTVQELIDTLSKIADKGLNVIIPTLPDGVPMIVKEIYVGKYAGTIAYDEYGIPGGVYVGIECVPDDEDKIQVPKSINQIKPVVKKIHTAEDVMAYQARQNINKFEGSSYDDFLRFVKKQIDGDN